MAQNPLRAMDDDARAMITGLLNDFKHAALAVQDPGDGLPNISRIAFARTSKGQPMSLISDLSAHARALAAQPECALLLGEPGERGDPLTYPRLSLRVRARFVRHGMDEHKDLAAHYLVQQPKAKLYIGFGDFSIVTFSVREGLLNGGFGKAYPVSAADLAGMG
ncbi:HugZ family pyridoxamine 5'-phosphate oxidase [Roseobacteraceae bacterium S113]